MKYILSFLFLVCVFKGDTQNNTALGGDTHLTTEGTFNTAIGTAAIYCIPPYYNNGFGCVLEDTSEPNVSICCPEDFQFSSNGDNNIAIGHLGYYPDTYNYALNGTLIIADTSIHFIKIGEQVFEIKRTVSLEPLSHFGRQSGQSNTTGNSNTYFGYEALKQNTTGYPN